MFMLAKVFVKPSETISEASPYTYERGSGFRLEN
jgi:hypothetical protein